MNPLSPFERETRPLRVADLISSLSYALDLTEGQPMGWAVRTCRFGMRLAETVGMPEEHRADLYYALLLKDSGCSSNAARIRQIFDSDDLRTKREMLVLDWTKPSLRGFVTALRNTSPQRGWLARTLRVARLGAKRQQSAIEVILLRCERGADIVRKMGFNLRTAEAIRSLDEHWDGHGAAQGLKGAEIPLSSRILNLAQTLALFNTAHGPQAAIEVACERRGKWFDPELVRAAETLLNEPELWRPESEEETRRQVINMDPGSVIEVDDARFDGICEGFADVIDAKSPFTYEHSRGVARAAVAAARNLHLAEKDVTLIRRAALLHDIGKLGVSNSILDKPEPLTETEWAAVRMHPYYTQRILERVDGLAHLAFVASSHHERLDGKGYYRGLAASDIPITARVIAVADVYDALAGRRPYRDGMPPEKVFEVLQSEAPHALDTDCVDALRHGATVLRATA